VQIVVWYTERKSFIAVQRNYWQVYGDDLPDKKTVKVSFDKVLATGSFHRQSQDTLESVSKKKAKQIHHAFQRSPTKSICQASRELQVPCTMLHIVLGKQLHLSAYKVQIVQKLKPDNKPH
jgi:hypothetical protein